MIGGREGLRGSVTLRGRSATRAPSLAFSIFAHAHAAAPPGPNKTVPKIEIKTAAVTDVLPTPEKREVS